MSLLRDAGHKLVRVLGKIYHKQHFEIFFLFIPENRLSLFHADCLLQRLKINPIINLSVCSLLLKSEKKNKNNSVKKGVGENKRHLFCLSQIAGNGSRS